MYRLRLKELRESKGITMGQLADIMQTSRSYLYRIQNGSKSPTLKTLNKLCTRLGVTITDILEPKEPQ